jgi:hypothetical protein
MLLFYFILAVDLTAPSGTHYIVPDDWTIITDMERVIMV